MTADCAVRAFLPDLFTCERNDSKRVVSTLRIGVIQVLLVCVGFLLIAPSQASVQQIIDHRAPAPSALQGLDLYPNLQAIQFQVEVSF
jgi:hypothetical protein